MSVIQKVKNNLIPPSPPSAAAPPIPFDDVHNPLRSISAYGTLKSQTIDKTLRSCLMRDRLLVQIYTSLIVKKSPNHRHLHADRQSVYCTYSNVMNKRESFIQTTFIVVILQGGCDRKEIWKWSDWDWKVVWNKIQIRKTTRRFN